MPTYEYEYKNNDITDGVYSLKWFDLNEIEDDDDDEVD